MKTWNVNLILIISIIVSGCDKKPESDLTLLISPYQDLAMIVNIDHLGLEAKYGTTVDIVTIDWPETYTTMLSANSPADIAFAGYSDYLMRRENLNKDSDDDLLFIYPAYIFKGGAFITYKDEINHLTKSDIQNEDAIRNFLSYDIGLPKKTLYEMLIVHIASQAGISYEEIRFKDVNFDTGFLAAKSGDLDIAAVGLTQLTETLKEGGKSVLNMDTLGIADITGFIVRESVLHEKEGHINNLIKMWFDCVDYVLTDIDKNSAVSLSYLANTAATKYTLESYKVALSQEYFPRSISELDKEVLSDSGRYSAIMIHSVIANYLGNSDSKIMEENNDDLGFIKIK